MNAREGHNETNPAGSDQPMPDANNNLSNGSSNNTDNNNSDTNGINNNNNNNLNQDQEQQRIIQSPQDVHTREKLFDFIALLQGRRMDDQRAILKPSSTT